MLCLPVFQRRSEKRSFIEESPFFGDRVEVGGFAIDRILMLGIMRMTLNETSPNYLWREKKKTSECHHSRAVTGPSGAGKIEKNGEGLEAKKRARGGLRVGPLCDPFLGTNAVNGHFLQFLFPKASYVFKGEDSSLTIDGVVRQLFAQLSG